MPLSAANRPVRFVLSLEDRDRNKGKCTISFPSTISIVDLIANLGAIELLVGNLSNALIVDGTISIDLMQTTAWTMPPEASDVERKGVFVFATENEGSIAKIEIPSINNEYVIDGSNLIDTNSVVGSAFVNFMIGGIGGLTGTPCNGPGHDITRLLSARKMHRGSGKG